MNRLAYRSHHGAAAGIASLFAPVVLVVLIIGVIFFTLAPWQAFRALRSAALAGDHRGVAGLMDEAAVRAAFRAERGYREDAVHRALGLGGQAPNVEGLMTPEAIVHFSHARAHQPGAPFRMGNLLPGLHDSRIAYWGFNRAQIAALAVGDRGTENLFTFERRGLFKWRLTAIHAP